MVNYKIKIEVSLNENGVQKVIIPYNLYSIVDVEIITMAFVSKIDFLYGIKI